jgi:hypothetical protein
MSGAIPPLPQYAFMEWCSGEAERQLYLLHHWIHDLQKNSSWIKNFIMKISNPEILYWIVLIVNGLNSARIFQFWLSYYVKKGLLNHLKQNICISWTRTLGLFMVTSRIFTSQPISYPLSTEGSFCEGRSGWHMKLTIPISCQDLEYVELYSQMTYLLG